jgi:branched-chain amino acid transport system substrate-binding protein
MRARAVLLLLACSTIAVGAGCGGSKAKPFRIGILSDCYGPFSSSHELIVASAELPVIERGAKLRGRKPSDGLERIRVAGKQVELRVGCVTGTEDVLTEARRLVEEDGAQVVVGPLSPEHGLVVREYARRRAETVFLIQPSGAPELTLTDPAPNVFRFILDAAQYTAGLGSYAYRQLGWRTAATVADDIPYSWANVAGFVAEFCALGGHIVDRQWITLGSDPAETVLRIPKSAHGVYLGAGISALQGFIRRYSARHPDLSRRLLSNANLLFDAQIVARARGLVVGGNLPLSPTPAEGAYVTAFTKVFPSIPAAAALNPLSVPYRDGVEAALEALEQVNGDLTNGGEPFMDALAHVRLESPVGRIHLDRNRQGVGPSYLSQVGTDAHGKAVIRTLRVVPNVEQTFGGYFKPDDPPPSRTSPACKQGNPPPWAR